MLPLPNRRMLVPCLALLASGALLATGAVAAAPASSAKLAAAATTAVADPARSAANRAFDESRMPAQVLAFAGFKPGQVVADWGAGGGYYSELIADMVGPKGKVLALADPAYLKPGTLDAVAKAHPNVEMVVKPSAEQMLAPRSVDAIFSHLEFHDLYLPAEKGGTEPGRPIAQTLGNWFAAVRPGGTVVIVDHVGLAGKPAVVAGTLHRIDPAQVKADMMAAGFVFDGESPLLQRSEDDHTAIVFAPGLRGKTDRFALKFRRPA